MTKSNRAQRAYQMIHEYLISRGAEGASLDEIKSHYNDYIVPILDEALGGKDKAHAFTHIGMTLTTGGKPIVVGADGRWYNRSSFKGRA